MVKLRMNQAVNRLFLGGINERANHRHKPPMGKSEKAGAHNATTTIAKEEYYKNIK